MSRTQKRAHQRSPRSSRSAGCPQQKCSWTRREEICSSLHKPPPSSGTPGARLSSMSPSARTHRLINKFNKHCSSISQTVFRATRNSTVSKKKKTNLWGSHASPKLKIHCSAKNLSCVVHKTQLSYSKKHTILHKRSLQKPEPKQKRKKKKGT